MGNRIHTSPSAPPPPPPTCAISQWARSLEWRHNTHFSLSPPPQLVPLANERAVSSDVRIHTSPSAPPPTCAISQWARSLEWRQNTHFSLSQSPPPQLVPLANERAVSSDVTLWRCTFWSGKFASVFYLFYCEDMLSLVVLWLCE